MRNKKIWQLTLVMFVAFGQPKVFSQDPKEYSSINAIASGRAEMNFNAISLIEAYNKPAAKPILFIGNRKARIIPEMDVNDKGRVIHQDPFGKVTEQNSKKNAAGNPSPSVVQNFSALVDNASFIPPDVNGAVGPTHIMTTLNSQVRIQDRNGLTISTVSLTSFWASLGSLSNVYDPRVLYDQFEDRWIMVSSANSQANNSSTLLAVSKTNNPTAGWNLYKVDVDATNTKWVDYPTLGFNDKWIVVQMNLFAMPNQSATSHQIYVWNKADVYAQGTGQFKKFEITTEGSAPAAPTVHYDKSIGKMFVFRAVTGNSGGNGRVGMRTITGPIGSEVLSTESIIQTANPWIITGNSFGDFAPQLGSTKTLATGDHRIQQAVVRDGKIMFVHTVFLPSTGETRSSIQWWQVDSTGAILQRSRIDDPTGNNFYAYPSIAVNKNNDVIIGYATFSPDHYPSAAYSYRASSDPINTLRDDYIFKKGESAYFKDFGIGRNRWGDYTNTVVDPTNDSTFWSLQEYSTFTANVWATWWAKINPYVPVADFTADNEIICSGESVQFASASNFVGTNYSWQFTGGNPSTSTLPNPIVNYAIGGSYKVILTLDGNIQTREGFIVANARPKTTITTSGNNLCVGKSVVITASQLGAKYLWSTGATTRAITVSSNGDYFCNITAANGVCFANTDTAKIRFKPLPVVSIDSLKAVNPNAPAFVLTGGLPLGGTYTGTGVSNGMFDPAIAGLGFHTITYSFTDTTTCSNTASTPIEVSNSVGINAKSNIRLASVTPNPSKGLVSIEMQTENPVKLSISVVDQNGKIVFEKKYADLSLSHKKQIDLSELPKGIYIVQIFGNEKYTSRKLVIE